MEDETRNQAILSGSNAGSTCAEQPGSSSNGRSTCKQRPASSSNSDGVARGAHHPHRHARHDAFRRDGKKSGLWPFKKSGFRWYKNSCLLDASLRLSPGDFCSPLFMRVGRCRCRCRPVSMSLSAGGHRFGASQCFSLTGLRTCPMSCCSRRLRAALWVLLRVCRPPSRPSPSLLLARII